MSMAPFFPIIYVRGYAMTPGEIADTVSTPYMGFNLGSTKARQDWQGAVVRHIFESPLIRLMKEYDYRDNYLNGSEIDDRIPAKSVIVYRYYDPADKDFGSGHALSILEAARGLKDLILRTRVQVCGDDMALRDEFRVYLVAHSMGGLVCRAFLQNDTISTPADRQVVAKVFTYATPHNGIEIAGLNVPSVLRLWDMDNFNRKKMAGFFGLPASAERVDDLDGKFDVQKFFCLIGTNHRDYDVALGLSRRLAGEMSDGLVKIENAAVRGAPRAFVYRSHSGTYGIVNSEEGYQNLVRFLFGDVRIDGTLEVEALPLPPSVRKAQTEGKQVRGSYYFEATVVPRGAFTFKLTERRIETYSAVLRTYDELFPTAPGAHARSPVLFSAFLDRSRISAGRTIVFAVDLGVSSTGYTIDGSLWRDQHISGEYLFRNLLTVRATPGADGWSVRYNLTDDKWSESRGSEAGRANGAFVVPLTSQKGFKATLRLTPRLSNDP